MIAIYSQINQVNPAFEYFLNSLAILSFDASNEDAYRVQESFLRYLGL